MPTALDSGRDWPSRVGDGRSIGSVFIPESKASDWQSHGRPITSTASDSCASDRPALDCASTQAAWTRAPMPSVRSAVHRSASSTTFAGVPGVPVPPTRSSEFGSMDALSIGLGLDGRFTRCSRVRAPICLGGLRGSPIVCSSSLCGVGLRWMCSGIRLS